MRLKADSSGETRDNWSWLQMNQTAKISLLEFIPFETSIEHSHIVHVNGNIFSGHLDHVVLAPSSLLKSSLLTNPNLTSLVRPGGLGWSPQLAWQEGHTAHATKEEATEMVEAALDLYASACAKRLADSPRLKVENRPMHQDWKGIPYQVKSIVGWDPFFL